MWSSISPKFCFLCLFASQFFPLFRMLSACTKMSPLSSAINHCIFSCAFPCHSLLLHFLIHSSSFLLFRVTVTVTNGYSFKRFESTVLYISLLSKMYNVYVHNKTRQSLCNAQLEPLLVAKANSSASACSDVLLKLSE